MSRETQSVLLLLVGAAVLRLAVGDTYLRYVKAGMRPLLLVSAVVLLVLGAVSLLRETLALRPGATGGHAHGPAVAWLLVVPVLTVMLVAPPALGSYAAKGRNTVALDTLPDLPPGDGPAEMSLKEYVGRAFDASGRTVRDRQVRLRGFASDRPGGGYYLTRFTLACCAADARSIRIAVTGDTEVRPFDEWLEVTGTYVPSEAADAEQYVPALRVSDVRPIPQPKEPYE